MSLPLTQELDAALLVRVQRGESECFAELVRRYQASLERVARSRLGRSDWAEDVVQETFLAAYKSAASYDARYNFRTWLWTILLNQCASHYHRQRRALALNAPIGSVPPTDRADDRGGEEATPLGALLARERSAQLEQYLARLSTVQADALRLRFFGGLKFQEIAETMQCSLNTAKNRVRWGLMQLAAMISAEGAADSAAAGTGPDSSAAGEPRRVDDREREAS